MLHFPEDGECGVEIVNGSGYLRAAMAESIPIDERLFADFLQDGISVLLHCFDLDLAHVDENYI